jgi:hypothetical protein
VVGALGLRVNVAVDDDRVAVGDPVVVTLRLTNEGDDTFDGPWGLGCPGMVETTVMTAEGSPLGTLQGAIAWSGDPAELPDLLTTSPARPFFHAPRERPVTVDLECSSSGGNLEPGEESLMRGTWDAWFSPGEPVPTELTLRVTARPSCDECLLLPPVTVELPITLDDRDRPPPPSDDHIVAAVERGEVQDALADLAAADDHTGFHALLVQADRDWLLRIRGAAGAVDVWFAGEGDDAGEVLDVQVLDNKDRITWAG